MAALKEDFSPLKFWTVSEIVKHTHLSEDFLRESIRTGALRAKMIGRFYRVLHKDLIGFIESQQFNSSCVAVNTLPCP